MEQNKGLAKAARPWDVGVDPKAICGFIDKVTEGDFGLHSFIVVKDGRVAAEGWANPMEREQCHQMFSLTKSFTAMAVGFAVEEGLLRVDDYVTSFFPGNDNVCENMKKMQVRHLLGMCTGHDSEPNAEGEDPIKTFLQSDVKYIPGSYFSYNTPASHVLSGIVQCVTGQKLWDYLTPRLFEPLGFENHWWEEDGYGRSHGGFGLNLRTEDIARFGLFLLGKGEYNGKRLINSDWIEQCTKYQMASYSADSGWPTDWQYSYGWQFWRCQTEGVYRADGAFGQSCIVIPKHNAVIAITSGAYSAQPILDGVWQHLVPGIEGNTAPDETAFDRMTDKISKMQLRIPCGESHHPSERCGHLKTFVLSENPMGIDYIAFDFGGECPAATVGIKGKESRLNVGYNRWIKGTLTAEDRTDCALAQPDEKGGSVKLYKNIACSGAWIDGEFVMYTAYTNTPHTDVFLFSFGEKGVSVKWKRGTDSRIPYQTFFGILQ